MKQFTFTAIALALLTQACKKPLDEMADYYPTVRTESVTLLPNGTVKVVGRILSEGDAPIDYAGICVDTVAKPDMLAGQAVAELNGDQFTVIYSGFDPYDTYYFRSWATNEHGYSYGNVLSLDSIAAVPVVPPCTSTNNTANIGTSTGTQTYYPIAAPEQYMGVWSFQANTNSNNITYRFGGSMSTGVYTTTTNTDPAPGQARISFVSGFYNAVLAAGSSVYMEQLSATSWRITVCQAPWSTGTSTFYFNTRFTVNS
ncbi:MAG: hypothetical protein JNL52_11640 [Flavobacteriales bacterium]|nr:hypothetical protein [Flavobacteriales bacterium]